MSSYVPMVGSDRMLCLTGGNIPVIPVIKSVNSWRNDDDQTVIAHALRRVDKFSGGRMADYFRTYSVNDVIDDNRCTDTLNGGLRNDWLYLGI
ncbi:hypothetical protein IB235_23950 [Paracoccus sp. PAR01]|nr:hypothetical protein [Paracoccus sp. PAR01]